MAFQRTFFNSGNIDQCNKQQVRYIYLIMNDFYESLRQADCFDVSGMIRNIFLFFFLIFILYIYNITCKAIKYVNCTGN